MYWSGWPKKYFPCKKKKKLFPFNNIYSISSYIFFCWQKQGLKVWDPLEQNPIRWQQTNSVWLFWTYCGNIIISKSVDTEFRPDCLICRHLSFYCGATWRRQSTSTHHGLERSWGTIFEQKSRKLRKITKNYYLHIYKGNLLFDQPV